MSNWMIINDDIFSLISQRFVTDSDKIEPRPLTIGSHFRFLQHKIWRHFHLSDLATFGTSSPHKEIPINDKVTPLSSTIFNGASPSNWKMMMLSTQKQSQQQVENFHFSIWPAARNLNHHTDWSVFESSNATVCTHVELLSKLFFKQTNLCPFELLWLLYTRAEG